MNCVYDFNQDSEKIRWLKTAFKPHAHGMLDRWRSEKAKQVGQVKAQEWMLEIIKQAKEQLK